ncbi:site-specific integrase [Flavobacteriaceae bacterium F89]|uniref:Site-specific integrase n=1 Tax=Cerina litoralis TaxID=2874477 RepID=A0AAE3EZB6_9FLAO|nr:phage integrase SAM-like domain-containing protein [Cerina litoralis]MCG2462396.1 site-specific integrase [Cerina litoralis]
MQTTYSLRKDKKNIDGTIPIRAVITFQGARIRKNIKSVKTTEKHWKNQRIKPNAKSEAYNNHIEYNKILDEFQEKVNAIFRYIHLHNISASEEYVLNKLADKHFGHNSLAPNFFTCFDEFIETSKTTKVQGTIKKYTTVTNFLEAFQNSTGYSVRFDTINIDFYEKFRDYSFLERKTLNNYFGKLVSIIKTFMTWSLERGYHENLTYKRFKKPQDDIEVIYLTIDELMKLYKHEFKSRRLEHVRDFYCLGCFTGLRFSDIKRLTTSNVFDNHLKLNIVKTRTIDQKIPLNKYSKSILDKYVDTIYEPIPTISSQKFNEYIKDCCEMVGINTLTTITRYIGQERIDKTYPKFKLITSHTARKTFVTNSLVLGMKAMVVRNITGHKDEASFRRYVDIAEDFKRQEMDNTWDKMGTSA